MRVTFLQQGRSYPVSGTTNWVDFIAPIGPNIKQPIKFTEVGADTTVTLTTQTLVGGINESTQSVQLKNIYDGMEFDLSALAPLFGKDIVRRVNDTRQRSGIYLVTYVFLYTAGAEPIVFLVYPCGSVRLGNTGAANTFSEFNYTGSGWKLALGDTTLTRVPNQAVAGFFDGTRYEGATLEGAYVGTLRPTSWELPADLRNATMSFYVRNAASDNRQLNSRLRFAPKDTLAGAVFVAAGETKLVTLPFNGVAGDGVYARVNNFGATYANFVVSRMMLSIGGCPVGFTMGSSDKVDRGNLPYVGYLTDYRDGYFNYLGMEELGSFFAGGFGSNGQGTSSTGASFLNNVNFPSAGYPMYVAATDNNGSITHGIINGIASGDRPSPAYHWAYENKVYYYPVSDESQVIYGVERYKKKVHHEVPTEKKIILRWLNSRGAWDSMHFVNFKMTPQLNSTGTVDSYDFNVSVVVDWDNEEALYYLTRSPHIMALTPADVGQYGWATSESNGVFALQGGNIGKTLNLNFNYKINQA